MTENLKIAVATNRKPADQLADVRQRIWELKEREAVLREGLLSGKLSLIGDENRVVLSKVKTERVDTDKLKKELGLQFLRPFLKQVYTDYVKLKKLGDG